MDIIGEETGSGGRYVIERDGATALMTYSRTSPGLIIVDHTEVPDQFRGQGIGARLAEHAIEQARAGGWKIIPLCPFLKAQVARNPDWTDVISG